jgi:hypothetical protein
MSTLRRLRQEDCEFEVSISYTVRLCLKKKDNNDLNNEIKLYLDECDFYFLFLFCSTGV